LKTLHLTNAWHASSGGVGTFYRALIDAANRERHYLRLVVPAESTRTEDAGEFARIYHLAAPPAPLNPNYRLLYPHRFLFPNTAIQRIINDERPDLIEISEKYTLPWLGGLVRTRRLPGVRVRPVVVGVSHERMDENMAAYLSCGPAARRFCKWYMKWIYFPMFDHHITVSQHVARELIEASRGHKVRCGVWVMPMGVDCARFSPARKSDGARGRLLELASANEAMTVLLYSGRLAPEKNVMLLLDLMTRLGKEQFRLVVAGDGILLNRMKGVAAHRGLDHVVFTGHIADRDLLADLCANADFFVHPNPREPFGIAPLEAMAAGTPLIAPDQGGVTSYADGSNAWLARPVAEEFASAIMAASAQPELRRQRVLAARRTAEEFDWPRVTSRFLDLYRELGSVVSRQKAVPAFWSTPGDAWGRESIG
jgi:alpha-1,6-mannosyltransferase